MAEEVRNKFAALKNHGDKLYKFQQRKSFGEINETNFPGNHELVRKGVCLGVAYAWVRERISTSNTWKNRALIALKKLPRPDHKFMPDGAAEDQIHTRNAQTMRAAALHQISSSREGRQATLRALNLQECYGVENAGAMKARPDSSNLPHIPDAAAAMSDACAVERLSAGRGIVFSVSLYDSESGDYLGGHAVAAYRSHGNHLFFFDSNIGAYRVRDSARFMQAWVDGCRTGRKWRVAFDLQRRDRDGWSYIQDGVSSVGT